jgi:hypothetical protein
MRNESSNLTFFLCHYIKKYWRKRIILSQAFPSLKIMTYAIIYPYSYISMTNEISNPFTPFYITKLNQDKLLVASNKNNMGLTIDAH